MTDIGHGQCHDEIARLRADVERLTRERDLFGLQLADVRKERDRLHREIDDHVEHACATTAERDEAQRLLAEAKAERDPWKRDAEMAIDARIADTRAATGGEAVAWCRLDSEGKFSRAFRDKLEATKEQAARGSRIAPLYLHPAPVVPVQEPDAWTPLSVWARYASVEQLANFVRRIRKNGSRDALRLVKDGVPFDAIMDRLDLRAAPAPVAPVPVTIEPVAAGPWRVGRSLGRTLYLNDRCVGIVDTPMIAAVIVGGLNAPAPVEAGRERVLVGERWELRWGSQGASDLGVYPHTSLFSWHKTADEARDRKARDDCQAELRLVHVRRYRLVRRAK